MNDKEIEYLINKIEKEGIEPFYQSNSLHIAEFHYKINENNYCFMYEIGNEGLPSVTIIN